MKSFLVFVCIAIPFVSAGIGRVTPEIEREAERLWNEYCGNGQGGSVGGLDIHCKSSTDKLPDIYSESELEVKPRGELHRQVVFVRPPSQNFRHKVKVVGGGSAGQKSVIYVLPNRGNADVTLDDQTKFEFKPQKPTIYYLNKDHGHGTSHGSSRPSRPSQRASFQAASFNEDDLASFK